MTTPDVVNRSAVLTPPGAGAIGIVRVTGPDAASIIEKLFRPLSHGLQPARISDPGPGVQRTRSSAQAKACGSLVTGDRIRYGRFTVENEDLDDVVVSRVSSGVPEAFDISAHGGIRVIERILEALERYGAPLSEVDEEPQAIWPVQNLIDQEALQTMSRAKTKRAVRFLAWQRQHLATYLEQAASRCRENSNQVCEELQAVVGRYPAARILIDGATVAIVGPPNSGKSTLFNRLIGRSAAIVSPRAGTTRDWVADSVEMDGIPVELVDTAGRHEITESADGTEHQAMEGGWTIARQADLCLLVLDGSQSVSVSALELCHACRSLPRCLPVISKLDLGRAWDSAALPFGEAANEESPIRVSGRTGEGVQLLTQSVLRLLGFAGRADEKPSFFTSRQKNTATRVLSDLPHRPDAAAAAIMYCLVGMTRGDAGSG